MAFVFKKLNIEKRKQTSFLASQTRGINNRNQNSIEFLDKYSLWNFKGWQTKNGGFISNNDYKNVASPNIYEKCEFSVLIIPSFLIEKDNRPSLTGIIDRLEIYTPGAFNKSSRSAMTKLINQTERTSLRMYGWSIIDTFIDFPSEFLEKNPEIIISDTLVSNENRMFLPSNSEKPNPFMPIFVTNKKRGASDGSSSRKSSSSKEYLIHLEQGSFWSHASDPKKIFYLSKTMTYQQFIPPFFMWLNWKLEQKNVEFPNQLEKTISAFKKTLKADKSNLRNHLKGKSKSVLYGFSLQCLGNKMPSNDGYTVDCLFISQELFDDEQDLQKKYPNAKIFIIEIDKTNPDIINFKEGN